MQYNSTFTPLKGLVLLAVAGLCSLPAQSHAMASGPVPVVAKSAFARITGKIVDENGDPLPGATVLVKGTSNGVVTNAEGVFVIEAEMGSTLLVSYLGYISQEVVVGSANVDIKLQTDATTLQDVVVIGYGEERRADVTGAIAQVKSENFRQGVNTSPDLLIQGKVAGVRVVNSSGEPGAGMDVVIRGIGSVRSGSTPLFVVDGVPLSNDNVSPAGNNGFGNSSAKNPLNFLNASDIESINVLKDASAAAIYGARGANGVVIITTKKGSKGKASLTADSYVGFSQVMKKIDLLSADQYRKVVTSDPINSPLFDHGGNTDWQDELFRTAVTNNQSLSFAKASSTGDYFASVSRMEQQGIVGNSNFSRITARLNANESFLDDERLKVGIHLTAGETRDRGLPTSDDGGANGQLMTQILQANPTYPVRDANGNFTDFKTVAYYNPALLVSIYDDVTNTTRVLGNIETSFRIVKGLEYKFNLGIDRSISSREATMYPNPTDINKDGRYVQQNIESKNLLVEHYLTYSTTFDKHKLDLLAGFSYQDFDRSGTTYSLIGIAPQGQGVPPKYNPGYKYTSIDAPTGYSQENELQSFFGRANYSFNEKYLFTASIRADGSTRFGKNNKYGYFPSFAAGWNLMKEDFMPQSDLINNLKVRASWGQTGNQDVPNKITAASYSLTPGTGYYLYDPTTLVSGLSVTRTPNLNLKWEVSTQYNIGVDFSLMQGGRLYGTVDYFNKTTTDAILQLPSTTLSPTSTVWTNIDGKLVNSGVELMLGYQIINKGKLKWNVDVNGATLHNEVKDLPVSQIYSGIVSGPGLTDVWANIYKSGYAVGSFFLYDFTGFDENGNETVRDVNGDGAITPVDRVIKKSALPKFSYGLNTNVTYGRFDLALSFIGQTGGYLINNTMLGITTNNFKSNREVSTRSFEAGGSANNSPRLTTQYLESSNFFRLNSARLGYRFSSPKLGWLDNATLYVTGQNLFTITNYSGYDPLINSPKALNGNQSLGIDYPRFPTSRTFTVGLSVKI